MPGAAGPTGPTGPPGSGAVSVYWKEKTSPLTFDFTPVTVEVVCNPGDLATGGGFFFTSNIVWQVSQSAPGRPARSTQPDRWLVTGFHREDGPQVFTAYVVCTGEKP